MLIPPTPSNHAGFVLVMVVVALVLFAQPRIRVATSGLIVLSLLLLGFSLFPFESGDRALRPERFLYGFGDSTLVAICALMAMGQGLVATGALNPFERLLATLWKRTARVAGLATLTLTAVSSAFMNNTPIVIVVLPILTAVAQRTGKSASKLLLPMGFATLIGGAATSIGTSTNLLVVGTAAAMSDVQFSMFDFSLIALLAGTVGILYLWLVAPALLPERGVPMEDTSPRLFDTPMTIQSGSDAVGLSIAKLRDRVSGRIQVQSIERANGMLVVPLPDVILRVEDRVHLAGTPDSLVATARLMGVQWEASVDLETAGEATSTSADDSDAQAEQILAEIVITDGSLLDGRSLQQARFEDWSGTVAVALHRQQSMGSKSKGALEEIRLRSSDVLLVQASRGALTRLRREGRVLLLDAATTLPFTTKAPVALAILLATIACAAFGLMSITVASMLGLTLMILSGCLRWKNIAGAISASVVMVIVTSLALAHALQVTGGSAYLADWFIFATDGLSPVGTIFAMTGTMAIFTNLVSNSAAAVIGTPVAIQVAARLGLPAEPFVLAVLFGVNLSYATPMAYQTNLIIMNAARYRFMDFIRVGVPLVVIMWVTYASLISVFYPVLGAS